MDSDQNNLRENPGESEEESLNDTSVARALRETFTLLIMAIILAAFIYNFVIQTFWIPSGSMEPTIMPGDRVLVAKFYYRLKDPSRGDIIVFPSPEQIGESNPDLIKRVIGTPGKVLSEKNGRVFVDGKPLNESYTLPDRPDAEFGPYRVRKGEVFVMGDNRANSRDSRYLGSNNTIKPIKENEIIGRAFFVYWPPNRIGILR